MVTPELLPTFSRFLLRASSALTPSLLQTRFLLRLYSRVSHSQGGAFTQLLLKAAPGDPYSEFTLSLLSLWTCRQNLLQTYSAPHSGLAQLPLFGLFWVLLRYSHLTHTPLRVLGSSLPLPCAYSTLTQRFRGSPALAQPLLGAYSELTQPLNGHCSAFTQRLLSLYLEVTQPP